MAATENPTGLDSPTVNQPSGIWQRILSQTMYETRMILRNGEQLLITVILPVLFLVMLARTDLIDLSDAKYPGATGIDLVAPGILALAVMSSAFTSQAIATAFDRRNGVLRLLSTTPLGRAGLLSGKILGVFLVNLFQIFVIAGVSVLLGWRPTVLQAAMAFVLILLTIGAFTSLALLLAGLLRPEAMLAVANLVWIVLLIGGAVVLPAGRMPAASAQIALLLPSGAIGEGLRDIFILGEFPHWSAVILICWNAVFGWFMVRLFRWD